MLRQISDKQVLEAPFWECTRSLGLSISPSVVLLALLATAARADVVISSAATENMSCTNGVCAPTAHKAVLNVSDLESLLAIGNVTVTTTGSRVQANDLRIEGALVWSSSSALALDAYQSLAIDKTISVSGLGGLSLTTNDGGSNGALAFGRRGHVTFADLSSTFTIESVSYTLVNTIQSLASAIASDPAGAYAFASDYDASQDGTYATVPIPTALTGTFEGLGNKILNLTIDDTTDESVGLFAELGTGGTMRDVEVQHANISGSGDAVGVLLGLNEGSVVDAAATGKASNPNDEAGGLVAANIAGSITTSRADVIVSGGSCAGGLVAINGAIISQSYASGKVSSSLEAGGLTCDNDGGAVANSYSTGSSRGGNSAFVGGLEGANDGQGTTEFSYSTGRVKGGVQNRSRGGFVGIDLTRGDLTDCYWDIDSSRFRNLHRGAGNIKDDSGITGLTTAQLQSGLPAGFNPSIWGQMADVNDGLPYLLANPPD